ncbi:helix-turn-helix domain-containing protein [Roseibacillus ishigakijimensis]|uniref:Helix-turn-helix domain-containing protein n=1 Tax=Roseibacillus ishigakijimensis TaxID=454146 RepID=A0A934VN01_9BACT|nr:helix-turn-helix domain-containing protein [Roseibacillus ishigakijimensis]MBK1834797.1 helix-turn-helix domain-containing protein [Roseibacillus ishigakijimensis]
MSKSKATKGKRYTAAEKQEVLDYVAAVDADKGRGGVAAAARHFGITPLTITAWKKRAAAGGAPGIPAAATPTKGGSKGATAQSRTLHRLAEILDEIEGAKAKIASLEKEYAKLKKKV